MLSHIYNYSPVKFERIINNLLDDDKISISLGPRFVQQFKEGSSIPDGGITQTSFKILVETKPFSNFNSTQISNHLSNLKGNEDQKILLLITINPIDIHTNPKIEEFKNKADRVKIKLASFTFKELIDEIRIAIEPHDVELNKVFEDYITYCKESNLYDLSDSVMLSVTSGKSFNENLKYNIFYDPADRSHNIPFKYIGLYADKTIKAVGELTKTVYCDYINGKLIPSDGNELELTKNEYERIKNIIVNTKYYDLNKGVKFMLVDKFHPTSYTKNTPGSLRSKRYFYLTDIEGYDQIKITDAEQLANFLNDKEWL